MGWSTTRPRGRSLTTPGSVDSASTVGRSSSRSRTPMRPAAQAKARWDALDVGIAGLAAEPPFAEIVGRLCCLRGVGTLTALALTVELGDWTRFRPQSL